MLATLADVIALTATDFQIKDIFVRCFPQNLRVRVKTSHQNYINYLVHS